MIYLLVILSALTWAVWLSAVVWLGPILGEKLYPWFSTKFRNPLDAYDMSHIFSVCVVALLVGLALMGIWQALPA